MNTLLRSRELNFIGKKKRPQKQHNKGIQNDGSVQ